MSTCTGCCSDSVRVVAYERGDEVDDVLLRDNYTCIKSACKNIVMLATLLSTASEAGMTCSGQLNDGGINDLTK